MAVRLQFINLIVPVATLERAQGGFREFIDTQRLVLGDMVWRDAHLCRIEGSMDWGEVDGMVERWEAYGLQGLVGIAPHQWWKDFAICASGRGPTFPCDWLQYDAADNCVYLAGTPKGKVEGPALLA